MTTGATEVAITETRRSRWPVVATVLAVALCSLLSLGVSLPGGDVLGLAILDSSSWMTFALFLAGFALVFGITYALTRLASGRGRVWIASLVTIAVASAGVLIGAPMQFRLGVSAASLVEVGQQVASRGDSGGAVRAGLVSVVAAEVTDVGTSVQLASGSGWSDCYVNLRKQPDSSVEVLAAYCVPD
jgi:hypothetical protein